MSRIFQKVSGDNGNVSVFINFCVMLSIRLLASGMMLRMFIYLYDLEIIDDEVFLKWKEDINEQYPGKGKALFEVCHGLMTCSYL